MHPVSDTVFDFRMQIRIAVQGVERLLVEIKFIKTLAANPLPDNVARSSILRGHRRLFRSDKQLGIPWQSFFKERLIKSFQGIWKVRYSYEI